MPQRPAPAPCDRHDGDPGGAPSWFRALAHTALLLAVCDTDGTLLDANRLAVEGCGFVRGTELGRRLWQAGWWAGDRQVQRELRAWCAEVAAGGGPVRATVPFRRADGTARTADLTLQLVHDEETGRDLLLAGGLDVTEQVPRAADVAGLQAVQAELSRALQLSEKVLDNAADGIYGLDAAGRVEFVNPAAVALTGHPRQDQLGHDQHALIHAHRQDGSRYPVEECPVWRALRTGRTVTAADEVFWHRDGTAVPVELIAVPTVEDGVVTGVVVSFRDLTERLEAERQAAELRRLAQESADQRALSDRLQQALLTPPPEPDHLHVVVRYQPAAHQAQVGGDWYDAFLQPDGATVLTIGDVVGHDSSAAAAMGQLRGLLRALVYDNDEPLSATLTRTEHAARGLAVTTLATVLLARIERHPDVPVTGTRLLRWTNAGHLPPVLLAPDGSSRLLDTPPDRMLGVDPGSRRADHQLELPDGHTLLLFTDGLVERRGADLDEGIARLRAALADLGERPPDELCDTLLARLVPQHGDDDVALLAVRAHPEDRPRPPEAGPNRLPEGVD
jgi:PAS domain S-box-containing protein